MRGLQGGFTVLAAAGTLGSASSADGQAQGVLSRHASAGVVILAHDAADAAARRAAANEAHLAYIERVLDTVLVAGPLYGRDGREIVGSLYVLDVKSVEAAQAFIEADPFFAAGVWADIQYFPHLPAAGGWIGGTIW